jgi:hypothetical protein
MLRILNCKLPVDDETKNFPGFRNHYVSYSFILLSALRQVHNLFQSNFSKCLHVRQPLFLSDFNET